MPELTQILESINGEEGGSAEALLPKVYDELRSLAAAKMAKEKPGQTLQATALVHEAWIKLAASERQEWRGRSHFFGAAAEAMRRILVDKARRKMAQKHGAGVMPETLLESRIELKVPANEFIAIHEALDALEIEDALAFQVVRLRYYVGMTNREVAEAVGISIHEADRHWQFGKAWLKGALSDRSGALA